MSGSEHVIAAAVCDKDAGLNSNAPREQSSTSDNLQRRSGHRLPSPPPMLLCTAALHKRMGGEDNRTQHLLECIGRPRTRSATKHKQKCIQELSDP
eukprot:1152615-Pelagomonas_calceolata.AAC.2